jgi:hypothetical protein
MKTGKEQKVSLTQDVGAKTGKRFAFKDNALAENRYYRNIISSQAR